MTENTDANSLGVALLDRNDGLQFAYAEHGTDEEKDDVKIRSQARWG